jgi:SIR2-like domain/TIR domain
VNQPQVRVFINYRRDDTQGHAQLLYDRLANRFGSENVFLDVRSLQPGMNWSEEIKSHNGSCHVLLALIGPRWTSIMRERMQEAAVHPAEDYLRSEIQRALRRNSGIRVLPVLMGNKLSLEAEELPRSLKALANLEVAYVREQLFDQDINQLMNSIEAIARERPAISAAEVTSRGEDRQPGPVPAVASGIALRPDDIHCEEVLQQIDEGNLVLFLGSRMTAGRGGAAEGPPLLPDSERLAAALAERFGVQQARLGLPEIAQYVYATRGWPDLYRELRRLLTADCEPGRAHRFLARLPGMLEELGLEKRYQLIISTSFDTALEQAFDDEVEPYDLAVYMASGPNKGKFVHFPWEGVPTVIDVPNRYTRLPFGEEYELERTVIVKIHGAVDGNVDNYPWRENYVITEDHYIDYLSKSPIGELVPVQILVKLRESHCLFLGYTMRDWSLRVFLKRIWEGSIDAKSWAVEPDPDVLERSLWARSNVDLYAADLEGYFDLLHERLSRRTSP